MAKLNRKQIEQLKSNLTEQLYFLEQRNEKLDEKASSLPGITDSESEEFYENDSKIRGIRQQLRDLNAPRRNIDPNTADLVFQNID